MASLALQVPLRFTYDRSTGNGHHLLIKQTNKQEWPLSLMEHQRSSTEVAGKRAATTQLYEIPEGFCYSSILPAL
jgi:hypothetical protein